MRKVAALLLVAFVVPVACVSSSDTPPAPDLDAGDAFVPTPEGGLPDYEAPDQATPGVDASPPTATILVLRGALPASGVIVVFGDATGAMKFADHTGQDGKVTHAVDPGAMVTALLGGEGRRELLTFVGVKPGDTLTALDPSAPTSVAADLQLDPSAPPGTVSYTGRIGACEAVGAASPIAVPIADGCSAGGKFPALVYSLDNGATTTGFSFKKGNVLAADGGAASLALGAWSTTFGTATISVTNAPQAMAIVAQHNEVADRVSTAFGANIQLSGNSGSAVFRSHTGFADALQPQVNVYLATANGQASFGVMAKHVPAAADLTQSFDLSQLLPTIGAVTVDTMLSTRPKISWTASGALGSCDGGVVRISGVHNPGDAGVEAIAWTFVVPPDATSVTAPALTAGSPWTPNQPAFDARSVFFVESDLWPSYDALRAAYAAFALPAPSDPLSAVSPPLPSNGALRVTAIVPQP